jgi:hypothetical protein
MKHAILIQVFTFLYMYIHVLNYGFGFISYTFGELVCGCKHTHVNSNLECIRFPFVCMLIYQTIVGVIFFLRLSSTNGCLV